jgi:hypothetical protein
VRRRGAQAMFEKGGGAPGTRSAGSRGCPSRSTRSLLLASGFRVDNTYTGKADIRQPGKGNLNFHGTRRLLSGLWLRVYHRYTGYSNMDVQAIVKRGFRVWIFLRHLDR